MATPTTPKPRGPKPRTSAASTILAEQAMGEGAPPAPPLMADTKLGPAIEEPPPPQVEEKAPVGETFEGPPEPKSEPPLKLALPLKGAMLRCDNFAELGEGVAVVGKVVELSPERGHILVWIAAAGLRWPVDARRVRNNTWVHSAEDYPVKGEDPGFDRRFRTPASDAAAPAPPPPPAAAYQPPRPARSGHMWVTVVEDSVAAHGFSESGERKRDWKKGEKGEINTPAVLGSPSCFSRL